MGYNGAMDILKSIAEFWYVALLALAPKIVVCIWQKIKYWFGKKKTYTYIVYRDGSKKLVSVEKKLKPKCF